MKKIFFSIIALCIVVISTANNNNTKTERTNETNSEVVSTVNLSGCITDFNSAETLVGVEVSIEGTNLKTYTDFDGQFTFKNLRSGNYKLVSSYISYNTAVTEVNDVKDKEIKIKLEVAK